MTVADRMLPTPARTTARRNSVLWPVTIAALTAVAIVVAVTARTGVSNDPRLANPAGLVRPERPLWGVTNWPMVFSWIFVVVAVGLFLALVRLSWRQRRIHNGLIIFFAVAGLSALDPPANWVTFTAYDPRFLHFPTTWAWMRLAPVVEPIIVVPGYPMYYFSVALIAYGLCRHFLLRRAEPGSWVQRHSLWTIFGVALAVGIIWDIPTELFMLRARMYLYSQAAGPRWHWGHANYPVVWGFFTWFSVAAVSVLFYRDDTGRSLVLGKLADRFPQRGKGASSAARQVVAGILLLSAMYCVPMALYGTLRVAHLTHPSYDRWSYTETKVYDPQGVLQKAGNAGPFYR